MWVATAVSYPYEDWRAYSMQYEGTVVRYVDYCASTSTWIASTLLIPFVYLPQGTVVTAHFAFGIGKKQHWLLRHDESHYWSQKRSYSCQSIVRFTRFCHFQNVSYRFIKKEFVRLSEINVCLFLLCSVKPPFVGTDVKFGLVAASRDPVCDLCCSIRYNDRRVPLLSSVRKSNGI